MAKEVPEKSIEQGSAIMIKRIISVVTLTMTNRNLSSEPPTVLPEKSENEYLVSYS